MAHQRLDRLQRIDLHRRVHAEAHLLDAALDHLPRPGAAAEPDERAALKQRAGVLRGVGAARIWRDRLQRLARRLPRAQAGDRGFGRGGQRGVQLAAAHHQRQIGRQPGADAQPQAGMRGAQRGQRGRRQPRHRRRHDPHRQRADQRRRRAKPGDLVGDGQHPARVLDQRRAPVGQHRRAARAVHQRHAQFGLQIPDMQADRAVAEAQRGPGGGEAGRLGDGDHGAQAAQVHCQIS